MLEVLCDLGQSINPLWTLSSTVKMQFLPHRFVMKIKRKYKRSVLSRFSLASTLVFFFLSGINYWTVFSTISFRLLFADLCFWSLCFMGKYLPCYERKDSLNLRNNSIHKGRKEMLQESATIWLSVTGTERRRHAPVIFYWRRHMQWLIFLLFKFGSHEDQQVRDVINNSS